MKKRDDIIAGLVCISMILHVVGYFFWQYITIVNLYYVSIYFLIMNVGLAFMLTLDGRFWRYVSIGMFSLGGGFLYMEFAGDPQHWTNVDIATFTFIGVNSLLLSRWIEKQKEKQKQ